MAATWTAAVPATAAVSQVKSARMSSVQVQFPRARTCGPLVRCPLVQPPAVLASMGSLGCRWLVCHGLRGREINKLRIKAVAELMEHKDAAQLRIDRVSGIQVAPPKNAAVASRLPETNNSGGHSQTFLNVTTEEELFLGVWKEVEAKQLPAKAATAMEEVYRNYKNAVLQSGVSNAREIILLNMATAFDRILLQFEDPFTFSSYHKAIRKPFDYYTFGQNYIRPLVDFRNSYVGNISHFDEMEKQLKQGHNIVLISNHQSEADPAVIALMLETTNSHIAERIIYIAGDRVVLDPVCKPFSMGRNLLCVYSKKHIYDVPELAEMKKRANTRTLKEMALLLRKGGQIIWIAPSGGRDRPDPATKEWFPAPFDAASIDNMRRLADHSGVPGHLYPFALLCSDIMPPPPQVEKEIGEKRIIGFHGVGISVSSEVKFKEFAAGHKNQEEGHHCTYYISIFCLLLMDRHIYRPVPERAPYRSLTGLLSQGSMDDVDDDILDIATQSTQFSPFRCNSPLQNQEDFVVNIEDNNMDQPIANDITTTMKEIHGSKLLQQGRQQTESRRKEHVVSPQINNRARWTITETLILIDAKRVEKDLQRNSGIKRKTLTATEKWRAIEKYCYDNGVMRSASQCRDRWEHIHPEYKKVRDYEKNIPSGHDSYWSMTIKERQNKKLPSNYIEELFHAMDKCFGHDRSIDAGDISIDTSSTKYGIFNESHSQEQNDSTCMGAPDDMADDNDTPTPIYVPDELNMQSTGKKRKSTSKIIGLKDTLSENTKVITDALHLAEEGRMKRHEQDREMFERKMERDEQIEEQKVKVQIDLVSALNTIGQAMLKISQSFEKE